MEIEHRPKTTGHPQKYLARLHGSPMTAYERAEIERRIFLYVYNYLHGSSGA